MDYYDELYKSFEQNPNFYRIVNVTEYYLPDVKAHIPLHGTTLIFMVFVCLSFARNTHLSRRPKLLFLISSFFYMLEAVYLNAVDISYLLMVNKKFSINDCSIIRNFVINPLAAQGLIDSIDRYLVIYFRKHLTLSTIFFLYCILPMISIALAAYNSFITTEHVINDEVCLIARRSDWTKDGTFALQWVGIIVAVALYCCTWRRLQTHFNSMQSMNMMNQERYYRDRNVIRFFILTSVIPIVLLLPVIAVNFVAVAFEVHNKTVSLVAWMLLDFAVPLPWLLYICFVPSVRMGFKEMCFPSSLMGTEAITTRLSQENPTNSIILKTKNRY